MDVKKVLKIIAERFQGQVDPCDKGVDFPEGKYLVNYISAEIITHEYSKYKNLENEIDNHIEENDLDDVSNCEEIKKHFGEFYDWFLFDQARLKNFDKVIIEIIEKRILRVN